MLRFFLIAFLTTSGCFLIYNYYPDILNWLNSLTSSNTTETQDEFHLDETHVAKGLPGFLPSMTALAGRILTEHRSIITSSDLNQALVVDLALFLQTVNVSVSEEFSSQQAQEVTSFLNELYNYYFVDLRIPTELVSEENKFRINFLSTKAGGNPFF